MGVFGLPMGVFGLPKTHISLPVYFMACNLFVSVRSMRNDRMLHGHLPYLKPFLPFSVLLVRQSDQGLHWSQS